MKIKKVENNDKLKYKDLLLLADEQMDMVEKYLYRGEMYLLSDNDDVIGSCIVTDEETATLSLKAQLFSLPISVMATESCLLHLYYRITKKKDIPCMLEQEQVILQQDFMKAAALYIPTP